LLSVHFLSKYWGKTFIGIIIKGTFNGTPKRYWKGLKNLFPFKLASSYKPLKNNKKLK
jgi:hypothetical protein